MNTALIWTSIEFISCIYTLLKGVQQRTSRVIILFSELFYRYRITNRLCKVVAISYPFSELVKLKLGEVCV